MDSHCHIMEIHTLHALQKKCMDEALLKLEQGKIIYLPSYSFSLKNNDNALLTDRLTNAIQFDPRYNRLDGRTDNMQIPLTDFMKRYAQYAHNLILSLFPSYANHLIWGKTTYNPHEIKIKRKDDAKLHLDVSNRSSTCNKRILRVFCNINPYGEPRTWNLGESFNQVLSQFKPLLPAYSPFKAKLMHWLKATPHLHTAYDHFMLSLNDLMKADNQYQSIVEKTRMNFPSYSTWIAYTDQLSHVELSGQYILEQSFYLPVEATVNDANIPSNRLDIKIKHTVSYS